MHIHKTGGQSLSAALRTQFPEDQICPHNTEHGLLAQSPADLSRYQLFMGHISPTALQEMIGGDFETVTLIREPKARLVSAYSFWRSRAADFGAPSIFKRIRKMTLEEFLSSDETAPCVRDVQYRLFNGARFGPTNEERIFVGEPMMAPQFTFVGRTEAPDRTEQWLKTRFGGDISIPHLNKGNLPQQLSQEALRLLADNTQQDTILAAKYPL